MCKELVSNIQRFSLDDGPGIRTTVFLKGCNLRCAWCHNPESLSFTPVLQYFPISCENCGNCVLNCPQQAHRLEDGRHVFDRARCVECGACAGVCRKGALKYTGTPYTPDTLFQEILKDKAYYRVSDGGVTFSGGEPAFKADFIIEVAKLCRKENIQLTLDTAGNVPFENYEKLLPYISLFLYDVKCFDSTLHRRWTQADNQLILDNLCALNAAGANYIIRVPIIPGFNADLEEQKKIARFLTTLNRPGLIQLLPYHTYGVGKYDALDLIYDLAGEPALAADFMDKVLGVYLDLGLPAQIP